MIKPMNISEPDPSTLFIPNFAGGISTDLSSQIELNQADYCENVLYEDGIQDCRPGQSQTHDSYGVGGINGIFEYTKPDGTVIDLEAWGSNLYTVVGPVTTSIYTALTNALMRGKPFNGAFYLANGTEFTKYDGDTVVPVVQGAYVPTLTQGRSPSGSDSTPKEKMNYLSNSWIDSFTADGTSTVYQLSFTGITSVDSVKVNGVTKTISTDYTVDLVNGKVSFVSAPSAGTNNVTIQGAKTGLMDSTKITKCKYIFAFDSRLWLTGNPDAPTTVYNSGLTGDYSKDGSYFPENGWTMVGGDEANVGFAMFMNELVLFKEKSIECAKYTTDASGNTVFGWRNVSSSIGCDMPDTIKSFQNLVAFADTVRGPMVLVATVVEDQRNVHIIGYNANGSNYKPGILAEQESDLKTASSCDDGRRYWLCIGSKAWVWDYTLTPYKGDPKKLAWWFQTGINARCWITKGKDVCFGDRTNGIVQKLIPGLRNDNGSAINNVLRTAELTPAKLKRWYKNVPRVWLTLRKGTESLINIKFIASNKEKTVTIPALAVSGGVDPDNCDPDNANPDIEFTDKTIVKKTPIKNTTSFQIEFSNNEINQTLPIVSLELEYEVTREV